MNTKEKVIQILQDHLGYKGEITGDSRIADDLEADSLDTIEIMMQCEDEFDVEIDDSIAEKVVTVDDAVALIDQLQND